MENLKKTLEEIKQLVQDIQENIATKEDIQDVVDHLNGKNKKLK